MDGKEDPNNSPPPSSTVATVPAKTAKDPRCERNSERQRMMHDANVVDCCREFVAAVAEASRSGICDNVAECDVQPGCIDSETHAKLEALLRAAGIGALNKQLSNPETLRQITKSVSKALDETAATLGRIKTCNAVSGADELQVAAATAISVDSATLSAAAAADVPLNSVLSENDISHLVQSSVVAGVLKSINRERELSSMPDANMAQQQKQQHNSSNQLQPQHNQHDPLGESGTVDEDEEEDDEESDDESDDDERCLLDACNEGNFAKVKQLLDQGRVSVHDTTEEGEPLLALACSAGYYELAQVLLVMRANVDDRGAKGDTTPLMEAASAGHAEIVNLLIHNGADVNAKSLSGNTPLMFACIAGHGAIVHTLLEAGSHVEDHNENGHTPLMEAASAGHVEVAKILLYFGAGINTHSNEYKESALTLACYKGHIDMVRFLLEAGADQEHKTDEMHTALMEASMDGHVQVARLLLDSGAQVNMPPDSFESPLTLAACGGHVELAMLLLERGANIEEVNDEGYTPLMEAAREGHEEMVALLLSQGADINATTEETQETALTLACCGGFLEVAKFLIKAGADMELGSSTALMEAAQEGYIDIVSFLLQSNVNVHAETATGDTALSYACENGHTDVVDMLLSHGASLHHTSEGGRTALMKAGRAGHLLTVRLLLDRGARATINRATSINDHTALSLACSGGHSTVVELLLKYGADPFYKMKDNSTMVIEAARGGHTDVVRLLMDYPRHISDGSGAVAGPNGTGAGSAMVRCPPSSGAEALNQQSDMFHRVNRSDGQVVLRNPMIETGGQQQHHQLQYQQQHVHLINSLESAASDSRLFVAGPPGSMSGAMRRTTTDPPLAHLPPINQSNLALLHAADLAAGVVVNENNSSTSLPSTASQSLALIQQAELGDVRRRVAGVPPPPPPSSAGVAVGSSAPSLGLHHSSLSPASATFNWASVSAADYSDLCVDGLELDDEVVPEHKSYIQSIVELHHQQQHQTMMPSQSVVNSFVTAPSPAAHGMYRCPPAEISVEGAADVESVVNKVLMCQPGAQMNASGINNNRDSVVCMQKLLEVYVASKKAADKEQILAELRRVERELQGHSLNLQDNYRITPGQQQTNGSSCVTGSQNYGLDSRQLDSLLIESMMAADLAGRQGMAGGDITPPCNGLDLSASSALVMADLAQQQQQLQQLQHRMSSPLKGQTTMAANIADLPPSERPKAKPCRKITSQQHSSASVTTSPASTTTSPASQSALTHISETESVVVVSSDVKSSPPPPAASSTTTTTTTTTSLQPSTSVGPASSSLVAKKCQLQAALYQHSQQLAQLQQLQDLNHLLQQQVLVQRQFKQQNHATLTALQQNALANQQKLAAIQHNVARLQKLEHHIIMHLQQQQSTQASTKQQQQQQATGSTNADDGDKNKDGTTTSGEPPDSPQSSPSTPVQSGGQTLADEEICKRIDQILRWKQHLQLQIKQFQCQVEQQLTFTKLQHMQTQGWLQVPPPTTPAAVQASVAPIPPGVGAATASATAATVSSVSVSSTSSTSCSAMPAKPPAGNATAALAAPDECAGVTMTPESVDLDASTCDLIGASRALQALNVLYQQQMKESTLDETMKPLSSVVQQVANVQPSELRHQDFVAAFQQIGLDLTTSYDGSSAGGEQKLHVVDPKVQQPMQTQTTVCSDPKSVVQTVHVPTSLYLDNDYLYDTGTASACNTLPPSTCVLACREQELLQQSLGCLDLSQTEECHVVREADQGASHVADVGRTCSTCSAARVAKISPSAGNLPTPTCAQPPSGTPSDNVQLVAIDKLTTSVNDQPVVTSTSAISASNESALAQQQQHQQQLQGQQAKPIVSTAPPAAVPTSSVPPVPNALPVVDVNSETESNHDTALTLACAGGHHELAQLLLDRGAAIEHRDKKGFTPLILASSAGCAKVVRILLERQADIEAQTERTKDTPLSLACSGGRIEIVEMLLNAGANKEHRNVSDYTPLSLAASGGYVSVIKLLLSHGAEINSRTGSKLGISPLMLAAMNGHTAAVKLLLDMGSDINAQIETNRNTALTLACFQGRHEVVSLLLDRKANVEHRAKTGLTPLMEAASGGFVEVGRVLLDKGADVNAPPVPNSRDTALTIAADKGHYRFVELLVAGAAQVDARNKKGNTSMWLAANGGHLEVVQLLYQSSADIDAQDNRKVSCLMAAFRKGHLKLVQWMVKHVNQFPSNQETSRFMAQLQTTDADLRAKCQECLNVIRVSKDRQAAEAAKNASSLLEELDRESKMEQNKKEAAARKREKKKRKKLEKAPHGADGVDRGAGDSGGEDTSSEARAVDKEVSRTAVEPVVGKSALSDVAEVATLANSATSVTSVGQITSARNETTASTNIRDKNNNNERRVMSRAVVERLLSGSAGHENVPDLDVNPRPVLESTVVPTTISSSRRASQSAHGSRSQRQKTREEHRLRSSAATSKHARSGGVTIRGHQAQHELQGGSNSSNNVPSSSVVPAFVAADFVTPLSAAPFAVNEDVEVASTKSHSRSLRIKTADGGLKSLTSRSASSALPTKAGSANHSDHGGGSNADTNAAGSTSHKQAASGGGESNSGWKEVVRKSKKINVPESAISRVIGRGGCNINAIRELSGAHIEVEKQAKQAGATTAAALAASTAGGSASTVCTSATTANERPIIIKGSAEATRQVHAWIQAIINCPDKDVSQILGTSVASVVGSGKSSHLINGGDVDEWKFEPPTVEHVPTRRDVASAATGVGTGTGGGGKRGTSHVVPSTAATSSSASASSSMSRTAMLFANITPTTATGVVEQSLDEHRKTAGPGHHHHHHHNQNHHQMIRSPWTSPSANLRPSANTSATPSASSSSSTSAMSMLTSTSVFRQQQQQQLTRGPVVIHPSVVAPTPVKASEMMSSMQTSTSAATTTVNMVAPTSTVPVYVNSSMSVGSTTVHTSSTSFQNVTSTTLASTNVVSTTTAGGEAVSSARIGKSRMASPPLRSTLSSPWANTMATDESQMASADFSMPPPQVMAMVNECGSTGSQMHSSGFCSSTSSPAKVPVPPPTSASASSARLPTAKANGRAQSSRTKSTSSSIDFELDDLDNSDMPPAIGSECLRLNGGLVSVNNSRMSMYDKAPGGQRFTSNGNVIHPSVGLNRGQQVKQQVHQQIHQQAHQQAQQQQQAVNKESSGNNKLDRIDCATPSENKVNGGSGGLSYHGQQAANGGAATFLDSPSRLFDNLSGASGSSGNVARLFGEPNSGLKMSSMSATTDCIPDNVVGNHNNNNSLNIFSPLHFTDSGGSSAMFAASADRHGQQSGGHVARTAFERFGSKHSAQTADNAASLFNIFNSGLGSVGDLMGYGNSSSMLPLANQSASKVSNGGQPTTNGLSSVMADQRRREQQHHGGDMSVNNVNNYGAIGSGSCGSNVAAINNAKQVNANPKSSFFSLADLQSQTNNSSGMSGGVGANSSSQSARHHHVRPPPPLNGGSSSGFASVPPPPTPTPMLDELAIAPHGVIGQPLSCARPIGSERHHRPGIGHPSNNLSRGQDILRPTTSNGSRLSSSFLPPPPQSNSGPSNSTSSVHQYGGGSGVGSATPFQNWMSGAVNGTGGPMSGNAYDGNSSELHSYFNRSASQQLHQASSLGMNSIGLRSGLAMRASQGVGGVGGGGGPIGSSSNVSSSGNSLISQRILDTSRFFASPEMNAASVNAGGGSVNDNKLGSWNK